MDKIYNIKFDDYKVPEEVTEVEEVKTTELTITEEVSKALYDIIYSAVYEAVKRALSE